MENVWYFLLFFFASRDVCNGEHRCNTSNPFGNIFSEGYKKSEAPKNEGKPVDVYVAMQIFDIYDFNEATMDFFIHLYFDDFWKDSRLKLDCLDIKNAVIIPEEVQKEMWTPDVYFENSKSGSLFQLTLPNINIKILPEKFLYRYARYVLRVSCQMDFRLYPMDVQVCMLRTGLFAYPDDVVTLHWLNEPNGPRFGIDAVSFMSEIKLPQFLIVNWTTDKITDEWNTGNYTTLLARFTFGRQVTAHLINTYIPSTLVVMLTWLSFWLDAGAVPARVTLGVTSLLTLSTQIVQSRKNLPPVSYINALDIWLFVCVNMVFSTLVEYAITYYFANYATPGKNRKLILWRATFTATHVVSTENANKAWVKCNAEQGGTKDPKQNLEETKNAGVQPLDKLSRIIFPFIFIVFFTTYWIYFAVLC